MLLKGGISDNNFFDPSSIAGNIAGAALDIASSLGGSVASGSNKLEHLFTIPNEGSSYNSFMPDIEAAIQSSIDEVLQGLDDMAAQAEWDDLLRHPTRSTRSITDTYYRMKNSQIAERQARQQSGGAGYKNIILKNPVDPQRYREIVKSALENRAEVRWNNRINADVRHYKLENLDLAHPVVSWLRDNTSDQNSEILRMYSVDALKRLALPDERRTEIDAHYFNEDVEVVKALNNIETYAKVAQDQIEANMAELKEMLTRQQALNNPQPSSMDTPSLADLLKIEKLGPFAVKAATNIMKAFLKQSTPNIQKNGDVITSTGIRVPSQYICAIQGIETSGKKGLFNKSVAPAFNIVSNKIPESFHKIYKEQISSRLPRKAERFKNLDDFSIGLGGIKYKTVKRLIKLGYFKHLKGQDDQKIIEYIRDHNYETIGEMLGAYIDRWKNKIDLEKPENFAVLAHVYHQDDKHANPGKKDKVYIENNGYGIIARDWYLYGILNQEPLDNFLPGLPPEPKDFGLFEIDKKTQTIKKLDSRAYRRIPISYPEYKPFGII